MNRVVFALIAVLLLLSVSSITGLIHVVRAESAPIYINADGSISPSTAPIYSADNITYILTGNITATADGIVIKRNNTILNGAGYTVTGSGNGISLSGSSNVTVRNTIIENFSTGIYLGSSSNNTLSGNDVTANGMGIELDFSSGNTLSGNNFTNSYGYGIWLYYSSNCTLSGNNVANNVYGILGSSSDNNTISGNNVTANTYIGILLGSSSNNTLSGNNVATNRQEGIYLDSSSNDTLPGNNVANNFVGIYLDSSSNNALSGNNVTNNTYGIELDFSSNNTIYYNNFNNNTNQVYCYDSTNVWDDESVGNYWSDYLTKYPTATETDGVWNTPYVIGTNSTDYYPLTVPYAAVPEFPSLLILPLFLIATLLAVIIYKKKATPYRRL